MKTLLASFTKFFHQKIQTFSHRLKVDLMYLIQGGAWMSLTQAFSTLSGFLMSLGYANLITIETYGNFRYILSLYSLFAILILPGIDSSMIQSIGSGFDSSFERGIRAKLRWGLVGTLAALGTAVYHFYRGSPLVAICVLIIGVAIPFMEAGVGSTYLNAKKQFKVWSLIDAISQASTIIALLGSMWLTRNLVGLMIAYCAINIITRWGCIYYIRQRYLRSPALASDPEMMRYARSLTLLQITSRIAASIDSLVLFHVLGPTQLAIFSIAQAIPGRLQGLIRILGTLAFPKFIGRPLSEISRILPIKMIQLGALLLSACLIYYVCAPWLFHTFFPKYLPSVPYSRLFMFTNLASVTYVMSTFLTAHKKVKESSLLTFSGLTIKIACLLIFVPLYGIWGAVISSLAASLNSLIFSFGILLWYQHKERKGSTPLAPV